MQPRGSLPRVKLDLTADERIVHRPVERAVSHLYSDYPEDGMSARTYPLAELVGEKTRALGERARPRDLYDVISLFRREDLRPDAAAILHVLREKCEFKGIQVPNPASLQPFREEMESDWEVMLGHQRPAVPPTESFWSAIPEFFTWLHGSIASSSPTPMPIGPDEEVVSPSSTSQDLGMNASTLERIRFAAANRLCVDVGYEGDVQRVEPYSLRKARGGNVVLYACEAGSSECATYRTGGISEVEVTRQTFVPKYARGTCKGWSHTHCARLAAAMLCYMPARPAPPNVLPIELAAFRRLRSQGRRSFRSTPTSCCRRAARSLSEKQCSKRYASLVECKDANYSTTKSRLL